MTRMPRTIGAMSVGSSKWLWVINGFAVGSLDRSRTVPTLFGRNNSTTAVKPFTVGAVRMSPRNGHGFTNICTSQSASPSTVRSSAPASTPLDDRMPRPVAR